MVCDSISAVPIDITITGQGYKLKEEVCIYEDPMTGRRTLTPDLKWTKLMSGHMQCNDVREFATMWKSGENWN